MKFKHIHNDDVVYLAANIIIIISFIAGLLLRLRMYLQDRSFWLDTANLANNVVGKNYSDLWLILDRGQSAPVGFLLASKYIGGHFDYSEYSLLFLPFVFGAGALVAFFYLSKDILGAKYATLAFALFSFCSTAIYYSGEFKQYSGDLFFSVLILFVAHRILTTQYKLSWIIMLALVGVISVWFSNTAIIMLAGTGLALFINDIKFNCSRNLAFLSVAGFIVLAHFLALYFLQIRHAIPESMFSYWQNGFAPLAPFNTKTVLWWYETFVGYINYPLGFQGYGVWLALFVVVFGIGALSVDYNSNALFKLLIIPVVILIFLSILHLYPITTGKSDINSRLVLFTTPVGFLFLAIGVKKLSRLFPSKLPVAVIMGAFFVLNVMNHMLPWPKYMMQEMKPLVSYLQKNISPDDLVYVENEALPAFKYYTRHDPIEYIEGKTDEALVYPGEVDELPRKKIIWAVISHDYINKHGIIKRQFESHGATVRVQKFPGPCWLLLAVPNNM